MISRRHVLALVASLVSRSATSLAQGSSVSRITLFNNVRVFDGSGRAPTEAVNVLVRGNKIDQISSKPIPVEKSADVRIIEGSGRTLMPGLIDAHTHMIMSDIPMATLMTADPDYIMLRAGEAAGDMLMRGFTAVRDVGGPSFGLKRAIDEGYVTGPRIWPSGAMISQTSGHGDFRTLMELSHGHSEVLTGAERFGTSAIADGVPEMLRRVREQLTRGASQIKVMAGGGGSSSYGPLDVIQYSEEEMHAAVAAAEDWGTYVTVHAYTPRAVQMALRAGVRCVEHGQLLDRETVRIMADKGVWWCLQPFLDDEDAIPVHKSSRGEQLQITSGTDEAYRLAKKHNVNLAWGTDTLFDPKRAKLQGAQLTKLVRWFRPGEVLKMATADNAALLALSGPRNPYPGKLGVIEEGALADILLVDGNPVENLDLIADPKKNFRVIMKDGIIYKNTL